jgi:DNA-binding response OmpR family regulator
MDADERTATLDGEEIPMTSREFNILYKLLSYPKRTFTRTQLMDEFWDVDTETAPRAVDVYMTKLRSKLSDCNDFEIQTVHGLGYKAVIK